MKMIFALLVLVSCQSPTYLFTGERCQTYFSFDQNQRIIPESSVCRCTDYKISKEFIGNVTDEVTRHPIEYCHGKIGFSVKQNAELVGFYFDVRDAIKQAEQNAAD
jgi:hypothetical protein